MTTSSLQAEPDYASQSEPQSHRESMKLIRLALNALQGAAAAICAVIAMVAVSALALFLLDAGSYSSTWSLAMVLTGMAVGGSVSAGSETQSDTSPLGGLFGLFSGGGMSPSMTGAADAVPLGVTLAGSIILWVVFSWRLRERQFGALAARASGTIVTALFAFKFVVGHAHGSAALPASALPGMGVSGNPSCGFSGPSGAGGPFGELFKTNSPLGKLFGSGGPLGNLMGGGPGPMTPPALTYHLNGVGFGVMAWVVVVLCAGWLMSRRLGQRTGGFLQRLRSGCGPSLSAVVRTTVVLCTMLPILLAVVGLVADGKVGKFAGALLLLAPNALAVLFSLGVGSAWTAEVHQVQAATTKSSNPFAGLLGSMGGPGCGQIPDRTEHLRSLSAGGLPVAFIAFTVTCLVLLGCAYWAARVTDPAHTLPLHPYKGRLARHIGLAERFSLVTAFVLGGATWMTKASGNFSMSMFGKPQGATAELNGSVLCTILLGLLVGAAIGFIGSLLAKSPPTGSPQLQSEIHNPTPQHADSITEQMRQPAAMSKTTSN